jgi:hypothetical protein
LRRRDVQKDDPLLPPKSGRRYRGAAGPCQDDERCIARWGRCSKQSVAFHPPLVFGKCVVDLSRPSLQYADGGPCLGCEVLASRQHLRPCRLAPGQTLPSLDQVLGAPLLRVLGRTPVGRQVIIDGLMSCVNGHRPRKPRWGASSRRVVPSCLRPSARRERTALECQRSSPTYAAHRQTAGARGPRARITPAESAVVRADAG